MTKKTLDLIKEQIKTNKIILYMKGTPNLPLCGFSAKAVQLLRLYLTQFKYINILENNHIRYELPIFAKWPTFPQLWVNSKLIGGSDIIIELHTTGKLKKIIKTSKGKL